MGTDEAYLAENRVDIVEMWLPAVRDEELALVGIGTFVRHRHLVLGVGTCNA